MIKKIIDVASKTEFDAYKAEYANQKYVSPDDFSGTDLAKVQAAYDYCLANDISVIKLNRDYDLTGGSIYLSTTNYLESVWFIDGRLIKSDSGYMFTRTVSDKGTDAPRFYKVKFLGDSTSVNKAVIIDGDNMIRPVFSDCYFNYISAVHSTDYTQSIRIDGCEMFRATDNFISSTNHIDLVLTNNKFETSPSYPLVYSLNNSGSTFAVTVCRIENNVIEGYTNVSPIQISSGIGLSIKNNYFEANKVDIDFIATTGLKNVSGEISGNGFFGSLDVTNIKFNSLTNVAKLKVSDCTSNIPNDALKGFMSKAPAIIDNIYLNAGGTMLIGGVPYTQKVRDLFTITISEVSAGVGLRVKIDNFMRKGTSIVDVLGMSYLVNISASMRSTTNYRSSYTGILSFIGVLSGTVQAKVMLTHLNKAGTDAPDDGSQGLDANISVKFYNADSVVVPVTTTDESIVIDFSQLKYTGTALIEKAIVKPLDTLLNESTYYMPKY